VKKTKKNSTSKNQLNVTEKCIIFNEKYNTGTNNQCNATDKIIVKSVSPAPLNAPTIATNTASKRTYNAAILLSLTPEQSILL